MKRSLGHLLLILLVLACPVQCVVGGDSCCDATPTESASVSSAATARTCLESHSCCHHEADEFVHQNAADEHPAHAPLPDDDCQCDCLCKGAISASVQIVEDHSRTMLNESLPCSTVQTDAYRQLATPQTEPPDAITGREIRTLRMSFQV
jgi:hypothetical protein